MGHIEAIPDLHLTILVGRRIIGQEHFDRVSPRQPLPCQIAANVSRYVQIATHQHGRRQNRVVHLIIRFRRRILPIIRRHTKNRTKSRQYINTQPTIVIYVILGDGYSICNVTQNSYARSSGPTVIFDDVPFDQYIAVAVIDYDPGPGPSRCSRILYGIVLDAVIRYFRSSISKEDTRIRTLHRSYQIIPDHTLLPFFS